LRLALVQEPEKVEQTFGYFTRNEFPDVPWVKFLDEIRLLDEVLTKTTPVVSPSPVTTRSKLRGIAGKPPIPVREAA